MALGPAWQIVAPDRADAGPPVVAAAIHDGHILRDDVRAISGLTDDERLREEDPFTAAWAERLAATRIIGRRSRFEFDLNRPPEKAVYRTPEDAWGLSVWRKPPPESLLIQSQSLYQGFYDEVTAAFETLLQTHPRLLVVDLHTYNHRRGGPDALPADGATNPEVNLGTGNVDRATFGPVIERFMETLPSSLDVRENVKFLGGYFGQFLNDRFPGRVCVLSIEVKKFFMDEWTGELNVPMHAEIGAALSAATEAAVEELPH